MERALDANRAAVQTPPVCGAAFRVDAGHMVEKGTVSEAEALARKHPIAAFNLEEALFEAAASSETVRWIATLGPGAADGAIDLCPEHLHLDTAKTLRVPEVRPLVGTLTSDGEPLFHEQSALLAAALDIVGKAGIVAGSHILSTLSPASFAGLVTGPVASLLSGAPLTLFGPFEAVGFVAAIDSIRANHCVFPAAILPDLGRAGLLQDKVLATAVAVIRGDAALELQGDCPLIEVHTLGESGINVQRRV